MIWGIDKSFEFTAHHDLEVCKRLLLALRSPKETTRGRRFTLNAVRVNLYREGENVAFGIRIRISGNTWVESKGTLRKGPNHTVIVSGQAHIPWLPVIMSVWGIITGIVIAVAIHPLVAIVFPGIWLLVAVTVMLASVRDRDRLEAWIIDTLAGQNQGRQLRDLGHRTTF